MRLACAVLLGLACASTAQAHGPYPRTRALDINADGHLLLNASFGLLRSSNDGQSWSWTCLESLGFKVDDAPTLFTAIGDDGTLHAASAFGLYRYEDQSCEWQQPPELNADFHTGLVRNPATDDLWTLTSNASGQNFVYRSTDGITWMPHGPALPDLLLEGLAVGTAGAKQVFVSAIARADEDQPRRAVGLRLEEGSWQSSVISELENPNFAEVLTHRLPAGAPIVVALTDRSIGSVSNTLISHDAGSSWEVIAELEGQRVIDAVWDPAGETLWIGGRAGVGIWQSKDNGRTLEQVNRDVEATCLYRHEGALFACTDQFTEGAMLSKSTDDGRTFEAVAGFDDIDAEYECSRDTPLGQTCQTPSLDIQNDLSIVLRPPPSAENGGCSCVTRTREFGFFPLYFAVLLCSWLTRRRGVTK